MMNNHSDSFAPATRFPATRWSAIAATSSADASERTRGLELLIRAYWKPVYHFIRLRWHKTSEDAKDLTQSFFTAVLEKDYFQTYDPTKARFRTFLITCLNGFIANEEKAARRLKRGGAMQRLALDFDAIEEQGQELNLAAAQSPEAVFEKEWARSFFGLALDELERACEVKGRQTQFRLFARYYIEGADEAGKITYAQMAEQFGLSATQVTNYLALMRREFRNTLLAKLREITVNDAEFRREARALLGDEP